MRDFLWKTDMQKEYWINKWLDNDIGFNQEEPHAYLQKFFSCLNLPQKAAVLVPLCGKSVDLLWLLGQGMQVVGVELSEKACQDFFTENHLAYEVIESGAFKVFRGKNIELYAGDFLQIKKSMLPAIDAVYDRAALIALPEAMRKQYTSHQLSLFNENTQMLLIVTEYDQTLMPGPPFAVSLSEIETHYGGALSVEMRYSKEIEAIPTRLKERGLTKAFEKIYYLKVNAPLPFVIES